MLAVLEASYARLPLVPRPALNVCLDGYFRISHTEPLIQRALERSLHRRDRIFWKSALDGERGHAGIYLDDLVISFGIGVVAKIRQYQPCPETIALLQWADTSHLNGALYRLYLEYLTARHSDLLAGLAPLLPRTVALHLAADQAHWRETYRYVEQRGGIPETAILLIEHALTAEIRRDGPTEAVA
jgi:hypothetical protein